MPLFFTQVKLLSKTLHELRLMYAGSVPLAKQERLAGELRLLRAERRAAEEKEREVAARLAEAEDRAAELTVKQESEWAQLNS